jgi:peroxiredoxin
VSAPSVRAAVLVAFSLVRLVRLVLLAPLVLAGCASRAGDRSGHAAAPTWERPGLGGAVRPEMGSPQPGEAAPALTLPDLDGHPVSLESLRGSWVVLHFTASWCPFCDTEAPYLGALAEDFASRNVKTVVVDVEEDAADWRAYASQHIARSVVALHDASGAASARFAPPGSQPSFDDRAQAVLDATLILDDKATIRLFLLPDSAHFDPTFRAVRAELERLLPVPVVTVQAAPSTIATGQRGDLVVRIRVADGYHIMADHPSAPTYVPTRVEVHGEQGIDVEDARYPAPLAFELADHGIATFQGAIDVRLTVAVANDTPPGPRRLRGTVRYQACTASLCLFPTRRTFEVPVVVF